MADRRPRIPPLPEEEWTDEVRELLAGTQGVGRGRALHVFTTLARHPKLLKRWLVFGNHILFKSALTPRERELLILRVAARCRAEYEWAQHAVIGRRAGLTDAEIRRVHAGPEASGWSPEDAALLRAVDALHDHRKLGDELWALLRDRYDEQQILDLIFTVGQYEMLAMALNSLEVEIDEGLEGFPI